MKLIKGESELAKRKWSKENSSILLRCPKGERASTGNYYLHLETQTWTLIL